MGRYVPREWMLAEAYNAAADGDHSVVHSLQRLFARPFDEQDAHAEERYYRRAPEGSEEQGGIGFMS